MSLGGRGRARAGHVPFFLSLRPAPLPPLPHPKMSSVRAMDATLRVALSRRMGSGRAAMAARTSLMAGAAGRKKEMGRRADGESAQSRERGERKKTSKQTPPPARARVHLTRNRPHPPAAHQNLRHHALGGQGAAGGATDEDAHCARLSLSRIAARFSTLTALSLPLSLPSTAPPAWTAWSCTRTWGPA